MICSRICGLVIVVFTLAFISVGSPVLAFQNEPDGFRRIKWGTDIKDLPDMKPEGKLAPGVRNYLRAGDKMAIGDASVEKITYHFYKGRFCSVSIDYEGWDNFDSLKTTLSELYGQPRRPNQLMEEYNWLGASVSVSIEYSTSSKKGSIVYLYIPIMKEWTRDQKDSAKDAAADL